MQQHHKVIGTDVATGGTVDVAGVGIVVAADVGTAMLAAVGTARPAAVGTSCTAAPAAVSGASVGISAASTSAAAWKITDNDNCQTAHLQGATFDLQSRRRSAAQ